MNPFKSFLSTSVLLLSLQLSFTNAVDVTRDVVVKNQTILNYLSNESITIAEGNSLQLFDGPDITLNGDLTIDGTLCVGSYTVPNLAITFDTGTVINHGNLFSWNTAATAGLEPARAKPKRFLIFRLNHSAKLPILQKKKRRFCF